MRRRPNDSEEGTVVSPSRQKSDHLPELSVRWVLDRPGVSVALWGAKSPDQLDAVAGVMGWKLDSSAMAVIDRIVEESVTDPVGPEYLNPRARQD